MALGANLMSAKNSTSIKSEGVYSCNGSMNFITLMKEKDARRISAFGRFLQLMRRHHDVISGRKDARAEMAHAE